MPDKRRYAFEDYVRDSDKWYWARTKNLISKTYKKTTALVAASTAVSLVSLTIVIISRLRRC